MWGIMVPLVQSFIIVSFFLFLPFPVVANSSSLYDDLQSSPGQTQEQSQEESKPKPMDWSKPAVSRGFGLEAKNEEDEFSASQYRSGQVSYFFGEYKKALDKWLPLAEKNYTEALASIGWMYQAGLGVGKDIHKAVELYKKAAQQDHAIAQNNLGVLFENGLGVEKNLSSAREWYKKSAAQGYRFAEYNYANLLHNGKGGVKSIEKAIQWYQKAADQNVKEAKEKLAELTGQTPFSTQSHLPAH